MIINILLHLFFAAVLFAVFPDSNYGFMFVPVFTFLIRFLSKKRNNLKSFVSAFIIFFIMWLFLLNWLLMLNVDLTFVQRVLIFLSWIILSAIMAFTWALPFRIFSLKNYEIYIIPISFGAIEYIMTSTRDLSFLWITPASSMIDYPLMFQTADLGGSYLVTVILLTASVLILKIFTAKKNEKIITTVSFIVLTAFVLIYGFVSINRKYEGSEIRVALVQPNMSGEYKKSYREFIEYRFELMKANLEKTQNEDIDFVIFPETTSPVYLYGYTNNVFSRYLYDYTKRTGQRVVIGTLRFEYVDSTDTDKYFNSAVLVEPNGNMEFYDKLRPVPFVEHLPYDDKIGLSRIIDYGQGLYVPGSEYKVFKTDLGNFSTYICFESIFPSLISQFSARGAEFLINISEDVWFIKGIGAYQHYASGIMRSVENRRFLIRVSNPGVSAIIDPCGRVVNILELDKSGIIYGKVIPLKNLTFFTASGNIMPKLFVLIFVFFLYVKIARRKDDASKS